MATSLCLPVGIDKRAVSSTDLLIIPLPGRWIDRLADCSKNSQRAEIILVRLILSHFMQKPDQGWRCIELVDLILFYHLPASSCIRIGRHTLEHNSRGASSKRSIDDIRMSRDPAHICCTPVSIIIFEIKDCLHSHLRPEDIAGT